MLKSHKESNLPFLTPSWDNLEEDEYFDCQEDINEEQAYPERSLILNEEDDSSNDNEDSKENILPYSRQPEALLTETDPLTYNKAIKSNNCEYWRKEIKKEL
ncbi:hypothetical protein O181_028711 [Austropuccinia psidii MF-1]|uniref:Uncharacterized protein n=1 Tax=Austropuccinia psidii MF-1 TaxID=1389203 RepID=A0A9Q3H2M7_9BASI|nr:hypothetical protein [Austropuccinia psidii MF-1]